MTDPIAKFLRKKTRFIVQVTNDKRYYRPYTKEEAKRLKSYTIESVQGLYPQGRVLENFPDSEWTTIAPKCINSRLLVKQGCTDPSSLIKTLMSVGKFCAPVITPSGEIKIGESRLCPAVGSIFSKDNELIENIKNFSCQGCEIPIRILRNNNSAAYRLVFGGLT